MRLSDRDNLRGRDLLENPSKLNAKVVAAASGVPNLSDLDT